MILELILNFLIIYILFNIIIYLIVLNDMIKKLKYDDNFSIKEFKNISFLILFLGAYLYLLVIIDDIQGK